MKPYTRWIAISAVVGATGFATSALADPIYLDHQHGYGGYGYGGYGYGGEHGWGHGGHEGGGWAYGVGHGVPVYASSYGHVHCRTFVVHTSHGHHRRRVCE